MKLAHLLLMQHGRALKLLNESCSDSSLRNNETRRFDRKCLAYYDLARGVESERAPDACLKVPDEPE